LERNLFEGRLADSDYEEEPMRKSVCPRGELMFNDLEADAANALFAARTNYRYEPQIVAGKRLIIPDFTVGDLVIECTRWVNAKEKSASLRAKFELISQAHPNSRFLVVTVPSLKNRHARGMGDIRVASVEEMKGEFKHEPNTAGEPDRATGPTLAPNPACR
jgi:hypothetical protein